MPTLTTAEFIAKAILTHGNKYEYTNIVYTGSRNKVKIICKKHGEFEQSPANHITGNGCPPCGKEESSEKRKLTKEEFIEKSIKIHNNKYDYTNIVYKTCKEKIRIYCKVHGNFEQTPSDHLAGNGCTQCGNLIKNAQARWDTPKFIKVANEKYKYTYDYSKVDYKTAKIKVIIICKTHGEFQQTPDSHLNKGGCKKCGNLVISQKQTSTIDEFITKAKDIHSETYDYSKSIYISATDYLTIICKKHGEFQQVPNSHLSKNGCPKCANELTASKQRMTTDEFIIKAKQLHGEKYDYSETEYKSNNATPVKIKCKKHGVFDQTPAQHFRGNGCVKCSKSSFSVEQIQWLQYISVSYPSIQYIHNIGEHRIKGTRYHSDGYIPETNEVLEYQGCWYHGCKKCYTDETKNNTLSKKTYKELYDITEKRRLKIIEQGYKYIDIWQCDWRFAIKCISKLQRIWRTKQNT